MRLFFILLGSIVLHSCAEVERNCADFKTGTFQFEAISGTEMYKTRIVRNDTIEIEYFQDKIDTASIRWINDCEYVLRKLNPKNMAEKKAIHIKILTTNKNGYSFEFKQVGQAVRSKASATRLSQ